MPIKPENKALYPADWPAISEAAKEAAGWACQHPGCTAMHLDVGEWMGEHWKRYDSGAYMKPDSYTWARQKAAEQQWARYGDDPGSPNKVIVIVLTVAHLDHDPTNCAPENLRAWCQRHHLRYDAKHHAETAYMTRMQKRGNLELPL
jgi:hypothetical protein